MIIYGEEEKLFGWRSKIKEYTLGAGIHIIDLINWLTGLKPKQFMLWVTKRVQRELRLKE